MVLLTLLPLYLRMERGNPWRKRLAIVLAFALVVMLSTLSRSGGLGLFLGLLVLAVPYRRHLRSARFLAPLGVVAALVLVVVARRQEFFRAIFLERISTGGSNSSAHFDVYAFIPDVLHQHPWFGLGLNNFAVYYQLITGPDGLRAALVLRVADRRNRARRNRGVRRSTSSTSSGVSG